MQARLADIFVNTAVAAQGQGVRIRFVIETHSQAIVNRLGHLVESKRIDPKSVQVLLFERGGGSEDPRISKLRHAEFDSEGVLKNWPFGFFLPDLDELDRVDQPLEESAV